MWHFVGNLGDNLSHFRVEACFGVDRRIVTGDGGYRIGAREAKMKNATTYILEFTGILGKVKIWIYIFTLSLLSVSLACGTTLPVKVQAIEPTPAPVSKLPTPTPEIFIAEPHMMQVCEDRTMPVYAEPDGELTGQVFGYMDTFEATYVNPDWLYLTDGGYIEADYLCEK